MSYFEDHGFDKIMSLRAIEDFVAHMRANHPIVSNSLLLFLLELSKNSDWQPAMEITKTIRGHEGLSTTKQLQILVEMELIEIKKENCGGFDRLFVRCADRMERISAQSYFGELAIEFLHDLQVVYNNHTRMSSEAAHALVGLIFYRVADSNEMKRFFGIKDGAELTSVAVLQKIMNALIDSGVVATDDRGVNRRITRFYR